ncbi:MAG: hypothetical protein ACOY9B_02485 [Pseudomonadota bacterium]
MWALVVFCSISLLMAVSVWAVQVGRVPRSDFHRRAFFWGLVALCAVPPWLVAIGAMLAVSFVGTHNGFLAFLLLTTLLALGSALTAVVFAVLAKRSGPLPNNSSKPTPLRGAA